MSTPHVLSRLGAMFAASALAAMVSLAAAAPAHAHDELVSTDPAAGSTAAAVPEQVTLTFSSDLLADPGATEVQVTDASGTSLTAGDPVVSGAVVTQPLTPIVGSPGGEVTVLWRVVSSDGHPISNSFVFSVAAAPLPAPTPTPTASVTSSPSPTTAASPTVSSTTAPLPSDSGSSSVVPWVVGAIVLVAVAGAVLYLLVSRARRHNAPGGSATGREAGSGTPSDR